MEHGSVQTVYSAYTDRLQHAFQYPLGGRTPMPGRYCSGFFVYWRRGSTTVMLPREGVEKHTPQYPAKSGRSLTVNGASSLVRAT